MTRSHSHNAMVGKHLAELPQRAQHRGGDAIVRATALEPPLPLLLQSFQLIKVGSPGFACFTGLLVRDACENVVEYQLTVGHDADLSRIVLADPQPWCSSPLHINESLGIWRTAKFWWLAAIMAFSGEIRTCF